MRPLFVEPASRWQRWLFGGRSREDVVTSVKRQLSERDASYVVEWEIEDDVDLHIAFRIAAILKRFWELPNDYVIPADPFALLNPMSEGAFDDLAAVECVVEIETALGVTLPDTFWGAAYSRTFVDVVRFLEAEMSVRAGVRGSR